MRGSSATTALLQQLEWRVRRAADSPLGGEYRCAFGGRARAFDRVVKYGYATAMGTSPRGPSRVTKKFIEERELTVVLLFEDSLSLQFGSGRRTKRETLLELAGLFALLSAGNRDRAGFWHATPRTHLVRRPVRGRANIVNTTAHLLNLPVPKLDAGGEVDIDWKYFLQAFPHHSLVLWLSDFPPRPLPAAWAALCRRYQMIGVRVEDPRDRILPPGGALAAVAPVAGELLPVDTLRGPNCRRHEDWVEERDAYWDQLFPRAARLTVSTEDDLLDALIRFFKARMRSQVRSERPRS